TIATVTADSASNPLFADLATWTGKPCDDGSTYITTNNIVNFTIKSKSKFSQGTASALMLQKATITLTPADAITQTLPTLYSPIYQPLIGNIVSAESSLSIPIEIVTHNQKVFFIPSMVCMESMPVYSYIATIVFEAIEQTTGKHDQMTATMIIRFADFIDK
ncbi:MAG: hypothetical protein PHY09_08750, partial [Desulfuromonadaceae bacterium]|nr:hypothetical protein [Desulfuromonadaceae bacterium]MDD5107541.1 hypothetical protein [Desulfuromonadaceae bacterium]